MCFLFTLCYQMTQTGKIFAWYQYLGSFFCQNLSFWPPGAPIYRVPLNGYAVDYEDIAIRFTLNVFFVYFVLSNGPNWEDFCIISIFGVIFCQNLGFWPPVVPIYWVPLNCYAVVYKDIAIRFNLNVFFVYFVLSNGPNLEDFCIISLFGVIFGQNLGFWPPGCPFPGSPQTFWLILVKISSRV